MRKPNATGLLLAAALVVSSWIGGAHAASPPARPSLAAAFKAKSFDDFVAAIHLHESDGRIGKIYGDGGRSYGPLQISYKAWRDAVRYDRSIGGKYADCNSLEYSKNVMLAYLMYHDPAALARGDWETCARLWNSGPEWRKKIRKTNQYWAAVRTHLAQSDS